MSRVLLAEDDKLHGKRWAVKETYVGKGGASEAVSWRRVLLAEAELMSTLHHPNLPDIVDYYPPDSHGYFYVVMDYIEGETLQRRFERQGYRMTVDQVFGIALQLCDLLDYLHSLQPEPIIYRDLKPDNLMLDVGDRVRLVDFGIARRHKAGQGADTVAIGTPGFAAPEQLEGRQSDPRTDLYGLGALMFYLLSGGQLYSPAQRESLRRLPGELGPVVARLLRANPAERWPSARAVGAALRGASSAPRGSTAAGHAAAAKGPAPLIVAVGALYPGAGATFTALALARLLHDHGVNHTVIELPSPRSELFALLEGERKAPAGFADAGDPLAVPWEDGHTRWLPGRAAEILPWRELATALQRPMLVVDIGADWEQPAAQRLLEVATDLVYTADPLIYKLEQPSARRNVRLLQQHERAGKRVHGAAVKSVRMAGRDDWLRLLPHPPAVELPAIDMAAMAASAWKGTLIHDEPSVRRQLQTALRPWLRRWLADYARTGERTR